MTEQADTPEVACSLTDEDKRVRRTLARKTLIPHIIESHSTAPVARPRSLKMMTAP